MVQRDAPAKAPRQASSHFSDSLLDSMSPYSIRKAEERDCAEIARLASELGYPVLDSVMLPRVQRLLASASDVVFVAELANGGLAGWIHGVLSQFLESDYRVEIGGLVVDEQFHR